MDLKDEPSLIASGTNIQRVTFYSPRGSKNLYNRLWFTYLLIYIPLSKSRSASTSASMSLLAHIELQITLLQPISVSPTTSIQASPRSV